MPQRPRITNYAASQRASAQRLAPERERRQQEWAAQGGDRAGPGRMAEREARRQELEAQLEIGSEHRLEECSRTHPDLVFNVGRETALARSRRDEIKKRKKEMEARKLIDIRERFRDDTPRMAEAEVSARVTVDPAVIAVGDELLAAENELGLWEALKESVHSRSYALRDLVEMWLARWHGNDPIGSAEHRARERIRNSATERMQEARQERRERGEEPRFNRRGDRIDSD